MRKILVIAIREYNASVRSKTFLIGLMMMPLLMGGAIAIQWLLRDKDRRYVVIDRTGGQAFKAIKTVVDGYNDRPVMDKESSKESRSRLTVEQEPPSADTPEAIGRQRVELSGRVRRGELVGFLEIGPDALKPPPLSLLDPSASEDERRTVRLQSNRPNHNPFAQLAQAALSAAAFEQRLRTISGRLSKEQNKELLPQIPQVKEPVKVTVKGLSRLDLDTNEATEDKGIERAVPFIVPLVLILLMFMVIMMGAPPLMQGVIEEKMQRIAEVLLGSVSPFQMMLGKLLGMVGVTLTISAIYLSGAYGVAHYYGFAKFVSAGLLAWFLAYQVLAALMFGALFIAVGAACSDLKDAQNLMWPVMLVAVLPTFMIGKVIEEPNGAVATGASFFPFAAPMLMIARQGIPPGVPWWHPPVAITLVLLTTVGCVWAAGRIFRVGILMQGKGAKIGDLVRWVIRG